MDCLNPTCLYPQNADSARKCHWCGTPLEPPFLFRERYQILEVLGSGSYGRTYKARDNRIQKGLYYAIKKFTIPEMVARQKNLNLKVKEEVLKEAIQYCTRKIEKLATLRHPQIPQYHDHFQDEYGSIYLIQAFIPGKNLLDEYRGRGCLSEQGARELLENLLPVLQYLAEQQVVHQYIKPDNIIRQPLEGGKSRLFLIDFGGAKNCIESLLSTAATPYQTPGYDPPESDSRNHQPAIDVYSLGATCLRLLIGILPKDPEDRWILYAPVKREVWQEILQFSGINVTSEFLDILEKMLNYRVEDRYQSAMDVLEALHQLPSLRESAEEYDTEIADYNRTLRLYPQDADVYIKRGNAYGNKGEYDKALADYNRALKLYPQYIEAYNNRGVAYDNKGEYDQALADYNRAIELNPSYAEAYNNRGYAYYNKGEYDKAIANYNRALKLNPNCAYAYNNRENAYRKQREAKKSRGFIRRIFGD